jgi:hypothetical protein
MRILASAAIAVSLISAPAHSAVVRNYEPSLLRGLQLRDESIVLLVTDGICATCEAADMGIRAAALESRFGRVFVLRYDLRKEKRAIKGFDVHSYPTIIGFHGVAETQRLTNDADPSKISTLFASTVSRP